MKIMKKVLAAVMTGVILLSSSNVFAEGMKEADDVQSVKVNTMLRFVWPDGYNIKKIRTEGCNINCLKTYLIKNGFMSEFIPDNNSDELVKIIAYTEDDEILEVELKIIKDSEAVYTDINTSVSEITTTDVGSSTSETGCSTKSSEMTTMWETTVDITECTTTCCKSTTRSQEPASVDTNSDSADSGNSSSGGGQSSYSGPSKDSSEPPVTEYTSVTTKSVPEKNSDFYSGNSISANRFRLGEKEKNNSSYDSDDNTADVRQFFILGNFLLGDVNLSGAVDLTDLTVLSVALMQRRTLDTERQKNADIDGNGIVDISDLANLKMIVTKERVSTADITSIIVRTT